MIHFIVHDEQDSVGVVVVEDVTANQDVTGWIMDQDKTLSLKTQNDIPIGHKFALKDMNEGDTVVKYNTDIGRLVSPVKKGEHVHVHNLKTKRW